MKQKVKTGFTMIELSLSIIFIGILSLALTFIIANTLASYRRGLTLNRVNQIGQAIVDDIRAAVQNSSNESPLNLCMTLYTSGDAQNACKNDGARSFIYLERMGRVTVSNAGLNNAELPVYGVFCAGSYSYIWVSGYFETNGATIRATDNNTDLMRPYFVYGGKTISNFRLLKISDPNRSVCKSIARPKDPADKFVTSYENVADLEKKIGPDFKIVDGYSNISGEPTDLLQTNGTNEEDATDLVLYSFDMANPAESSTERNAFYSASFILGAKNGGVNILAQGRTCEPPSTDDVIENFDYCAINKFSFAAQTGGSGIVDTNLIPGGS